MKLIQKLQKGKNFFSKYQQKIQEINSSIKKVEPKKKIILSSNAFIPASARAYNVSHTDVYEDQDPNVGHAIFLHYPNFKGAAGNAVKIGGIDVGNVLLGKTKLPVGHSAAILVDKNGKADYYEYGRYTPEKGNVIGKEQRKTAKGGNWRHFNIYDRYRPKDNDSTFVSRIQEQLPYSDTGAYQILSIPSVDTKKARKWIMSQADDPERSEYGITNICSTGACDAILPFRTRKDFHPGNEDDQRGYSNAAIGWSYIPWTSDNYAEDMRKAANNIYIMNYK